MPCPVQYLLQAPNSLDSNSLLAWVKSGAWENGMPTASSIGASVRASSTEGDTKRTAFFKRYWESQPVSLSYMVDSRTIGTRQLSCRLNPDFSGVELRDAVRRPAQISSWAGAQAAAVRTSATNKSRFTSQLLLHRRTCHRPPVVTCKQNIVPA